jgi:hypothetical protein
MAPRLLAQSAMAEPDHEESVSKRVVYEKVSSSTTRNNVPVMIIVLVIVAAIVFFVMRHM